MPRIKQYSSAHLTQLIISPFESRGEYCDDRWVLMPARHQRGVRVRMVTQPQHSNDSTQYRR